MARFLITADYDEDGHELEIEVYLDYDGPDADSLTAEEVEAIFREIRETGELPEHWSIESVSWEHEHGGRHEGDLDDIERMGLVIDAAELDVNMKPRGQVDTDEDMEGGE